MMERNLSKLSSGQFDVVICGGGIYGAWCAYDAALRGLKVALVEQDDWANATSSASSKLVHGGLRYLEMLDFSLVKKALKEREMLLKAGPHRIWPLRFGIPVYNTHRRSRLLLKLGLLTYDFLAGISFSKQSHQYFNKLKLSKLFPFLKNKGLLGGFTYLDAQTDDARLVLELIDGATKAGALCINYCQLTDIVEHQNQIESVKVYDTVSRKTIKIETHHVIDTSGPWQLSNHECRLVKGVHLVLPKISDEALLLNNPNDSRVIFMLPWYGRTLLGTTDSDYHGSLEHIKVSVSDTDYLLNVANRVLKSKKLTPKDVIASFAGLRVLRKSKVTSPTKASRDWILVESDNGCLTSIGGKISSARQDASKIVDALCKRLSVKKSCQTNARPLPWKPDHFESWQSEQLNEALQLGIDNEASQCLLSRFGRNLDLLLQMVADDPSLSERIHAELPFIKAELLYCAKYEMVVHLDDLLRRRIPLLILAKLTKSDLYNLARIVAESLNWDKARIESEIQHCLAL